MKTPAKVLLITLTTAMGVAAAAWAGTLLYWHVRITSALRVMDVTLPGQMTSLSWPTELNEASEVLRSAGCRALPHLIRSAESTRDFELEEVLVGWLIGEVTEGNGEPNDELADALRARFAPVYLDSPAVRRKKRDQLKAWWNENGSRLHQWWRVWSSHCGTP
jgi:hypothetical protein